MSSTKFSSLTVAAAIVALILLVGQLSPSEAARNKQCPEEKARQMDECASRLGFLGDRNFKVPQNDSTAQQFCQQLKQSIACIQGYARDCLSGFSRQLMTSLLRRGKQQQTLICQDAKSRDDFRRRMACVTDDKIDQLHDTIAASIARYEFLGSSEVRTESRLPGVCCSYQIFNQDIDATLDRICGKQPSARSNSKQNTHEFVHKVVGGTAGEFFGLICDGHRSLGECKSSPKTSAYLARLEGITQKVKQGQLRPQHKSLVPVLLNILEASGQ